MAVQLVQALREPKAGLRKVPGTAELISFVMALRQANVASVSDLRAADSWLSFPLVTLIKQPEDIPKARDVLNRFV